MTLQLQFSKDVQFLLLIISLMWLVAFFDHSLGYSFNSYAILPRQTNGWYGIFSAHFIHWNYQHLLGNTIPMLGMGVLVCASNRNPWHGLKVTLLIALLTGSLVWLIARPAAHAGASGLIMGYFGYLLVNAWFEKSVKSLLIAVMTLLIYGGIFYSLIDFRQHISFEAHLFGFLSGLFSAKALAKQRG